MQKVFYGNTVLLPYLQFTAMIVTHLLRVQWAEAPDADTAPASFPAAW